MSIADDVGDEAEIELVLGGRLSTAKNFDAVLFVFRGRIVGVGGRRRRRFGYARGLVFVHVE
jgi:hypothetical protein